MQNYLISMPIKCRVATVSDALALREKFQNLKCAELLEFKYKTKYVKEKGQIVEEYQIVSALLSFNDEKDPLDSITVSFEGEEIKF